MIKKINYYKKSVGELKKGGELIMSKAKFERTNPTLISERLVTLTMVRHH